VPDIGLLELVVVGLVLFLVVGLERLPEVFSQVAGVLRKVKTWVNDIKGVWQEHAKELQEPWAQEGTSVQREIENTRDMLGGDLHQELKDVQAGVDALDASAQEVTHSASDSGGLNTESKP